MVSRRKHGAKLSFYGTTVLNIFFLSHSRNKISHTLHENTIVQGVSKSRAWISLQTLNR